MLHAKIYRKYIFILVLFIACFKVGFACVLSLLQLTELFLCHVCSGSDDGGSGGGGGSDGGDGEAVASR